MEIIRFSEKERWDYIIDSFDQSTIYMNHDYVAAFEAIGDGEPILFYYSKNGTRICCVMQVRDIASCPAFKNELESGRYFDMTSPYGYGGPLIEGDGKIIADFMHSLRQFCCDNGIVTQFVRFTPWLSNHQDMSPYVEIMKQNQTIQMATLEQEKICENLESKNRNMIRKAIKNGLTVEELNNIDSQREFVHLYNKTMVRNKATQYYYFNEMFFNKTFQISKERMKLFVCKKDQTIVSSAIILKDKNRIHYHLSASDSAYMKYAPNNLLLYWIALWASQQGISSFHLGGGITSNDGLYAFKKSFAKIDGELDFFIGRTVFCKETYERLVSYRKKIDPSFDLNRKYLILYRG